MEWSEWEPVYQKIVDRLNIDPIADTEATLLLSLMLKEQDPHPLLEQLENRIKGKHVVICGAGPSLDRHLKEIVDSYVLTEDYVFIAADGAASCFVEMDLHCDVIVTDLDGDVGDIQQLEHEGAIVIVHAHGDNMDALRKIVPNLKNILGSTQVEPTERAFLWGGFTDGDRASHIVSHYEPASVTIAGMQFDGMVGRWSKPVYTQSVPASQRKLIKLDIAKELLLIPLERAGITHKMMK